ncbi:hypothetical protein [Fimbriiglobus ruber]|uniref:Uncharacterized protein n=1 Tax=Fimbriiglobus ruber TaxID=1908690 RepID=A0A225DEP9_9BACT|nr:hypothetical protein [Fimbriiglobus ruber]OWK39473.1 hypothetical protein FRUB_06036 [Fimbriiglobus ruber]
MSNNVTDDKSIKELLDEHYNAFEGCEALHEYTQRHNVQSQAVLTIDTEERAFLMSEYLRPQIEGKTVVEIGGGIGLLAMYMGQIAKRVYCIEANPVWSSVFLACLIKDKPRNVSFLFGAADEFIGDISGDVALFLTHSGVNSMKLVAANFAPIVIDVHGQMIAENPEAFDKFASELRLVA